MFRMFARTFKSDLTLKQMFVKLTDAKLWEWKEWFSDSYGDYLLGIALRHPQRGNVKIIEEPDHFAVSVKLESNQADAKSVLDNVEHDLFERVLPSIGARDLAETDDYE